MSLTVCDPACGSGAFLIAATNSLGLELARIRSGTEYPDDRVLREAKREVLQHCIYGVDINPMAVELCKVSLWINACVTDKPLNFLDHHIKCGNSLIGTMPDTDITTVPDDAFQAVTGDDKAVASAIRKRNKKEREGEQHLLPLFGDEAAGALAPPRLDDLPENTPEQVAAKRRHYQTWQSSQAWLEQHTAADLWTAAFFVELTDADDPRIPTTALVRQYLDRPKAAHPRMVGHARALAVEQRFFHWGLEFPEVFGKSGFDVVLGNPPFLNAIREGLTTPEQAVISVRTPELTGTADLAYRFLASSCRFVNRRGWVAQVQPRGVLNARSTAAFRASPPCSLRPRVLGPIPRSDLFAGASVFVALVALGPPGPCAVPATADGALGPWTDTHESGDNWFRIASGAEPDDDTDAPKGMRIGDVFDVFGSMTTGDAYDVKPFVVDDAQGNGLKLVTTGLIDPGECFWGIAVCRYLKEDYQCPRIVLDDSMPERLIRRLTRVSRPKILVAGLAQRVEAFLDATGEFAGAVSTYTLVAKDDSVETLARACAHLNSQAVTDRFVQDLGANALGGGSITMRKGWLQDLTLPDDIARSILGA